MRRTLAIVPLLVAILAVLPASSQPNAKGAGIYQPIPSGYDFPAAEADLIRLRDTEDVSGMRRHIWSVFAGATQPAPGGEAIWETWFPSTQTFSSGPQPQGLGGRPPRPFQRPRQLSVPGMPQLQAPGASLLSFVMFNKPGHDHIRTHNLFRRGTLDTINSAWPVGTPPERREIQAFPRDAVSLKLVWTVVYASRPTPIHVWDNTPTQPAGQPNPAETWSRVVVVDASRTQIPAGETRDASLDGRSFPRSRVVSVNRFYNFRITAAELPAVRNVDPNARVGDYAVLLMIHITTKEIPDWVWGTFWWHDQPDNGPFAADRPASVTGPWRNYLMDVAYSMDTPREYDGTPNAVFDPYLEARFANGIASNCMTCHQQAVWRANGPPSFLPITRGARPPDDPLFRIGTKLDFLWSVALEAN